MSSLLRSASVLALLLIAPAALAQADSDGDGIPNPLELNGYVFNILTGAIDPCDPTTDSPCFVTDPLSWSSDGDPYSDFQEASGVNMDATVAVPYNSPLVAAYPVIEVVLSQYSFTSNATVTDATGRTLSSGSSFTSSVESTTSATVEVGVEVGTGGLNSSAGYSETYSETKGFSSGTTSGQELDWETATSTDLDNAGTLSLSLFARNTGGATALNVRPTFNVYIGDDLVVTVLPDAAFRASLAPDEASAPVVPVMDGAPLAVQLTFDRLQALQTGAPVTIEVVDILADIQRWRPEDSNWACGTGETCTWTSFQNQILPRTLRLLVDFGYSGDPRAEIPFAFRGNPFEYRVYTGSPSTSPDFTLRDVLEIVGYDVAGGAIEGRAYPSGWVLAEQPDAGGFTPIEQSWISAGRPTTLLDVVMPRQATLFMTSPDPLNPGVAIRRATVTRDFLSIRAQAAPRGGLPIASAQAQIVQNGGTITVPLVLAPNGGYWTSEGSPVALDDAIGLSSSTVEFTDVLGAVQRSDGLATPVQVAASCADVPAEDLVDVRDGGGRATIFPMSDLDRPVEAYCEIGSDVTGYWVPQATEAGTRSVSDAAILDDRTAVAVGNSLVLRSEDRGRTWTQAPSGYPALGWSAVDARPDAPTVVAMGRVSEQVGAMMRSTDGGLTWTRLSGSFPAIFGLTHVDGGLWYTFGGSGFIATPQVNRSTDDGRTWSRVSFPVTLRGVSGLAFRNPSVGLLTDSDYYGTGAFILQTTDGGTTWTNAFAPGSRGLQRPIHTGGRTWVALQSSSFFSVPPILHRSTSDGDAGTWETISLTPQGITNPYNLTFTSIRDGFLFDPAGMFVTSNGGQTWTLASPLPSLSVTPVAAFDASRIIARGGPTGLSMTTSGGVGVMDRNVANEPDRPDAPASRIDLAPNVPNPFRGRTDLVFTLDTADDVTLAVYDLLGREVARLVDAPTAAGEHRVAFDARGLSAGVYVARLTAGGAVATRQMTLLR